jgi:nucleotide-binding universal stress UspA family protein
MGPDALVAQERTAFLAFVDTIVARLVATSDVDPDQIHIFGYSQGGFLSFRYAVDHSTGIKSAVVVAAVDTSVDADPTIAAHIVDVASAWAESFGGRLVILTACPPPPIPSFGPLDPANVALITMRTMLESAVTRANELLLQLAERGRERGLAITTTTITEPGRLPDLIADAALAEVGAATRGLLVLGTRGRTGLAVKLLGSVAERTAHLSELPVLLLPPPPRG